MAAREANEYVLGTNDEELVRLGFQHRVWAREAFDIWERAGFAPGQTILDLGCGPGFCTLDLAWIVGPTGRVMAVDASPRYLEHLRGQLLAQGLAHVEVHQADVTKLDLPPASIDGAYSRWVLCFVKDPEAAVAAVARAMKPGAVFAVQDYFNYEAIALAPRSEIFKRVIDAVLQRWRMTGGDPDLAGRLPGMMSRCGLQVNEVRGIHRAARPGSSLWHWPTTFFHNFVPTLVEAGVLSETDHRAFDAEWARRSADPTSFFGTPLLYDVIAVKPN